MKKRLSFSIILGLMILLCISCTTPLIAAGQQEVSPISSESVVRGEVAIGNPSVMIERITAQVDITNDGGAFLVTDWTSKSKKSYEIIGDMAHILLNFKDEIIDAEVIFIEKKQWSGSLVVVSIMFPEEKTLLKK